MEASQNGFCVSLSRAPLSARHAEEEQWHCPPRGEADAHTRHPCHATMSSRAPSQPCLIATFV